MVGLVERLSMGLSISDSGRSRKLGDVDYEIQGLEASRTNCMYTLVVITRHKFLKVKR